MRITLYFLACLIFSTSVSAKNYHAFEKIFSNEDTIEIKIKYPRVLYISLKKREKKLIKSIELSMELAKKHCMQVGNDNAYLFYDQKIPGHNPNDTYW